ncbi:hypothetical protein NPIL_506961 [Nephila pilipes]|uniref:Uncharacterized protein n=1 Tax=Nephila pilipes TaxID=299642 RepID=A0A8X6QR76_NEPPI|nr:hypothetical protein NPIL_506961 [Nephila pilipes]
MIVQRPTFGSFFCRFRALCAIDARFAFRRRFDIFSGLASSYHDTTSAIGSKAQLYAHPALTEIKIYKRKSARHRTDHTYTGECSLAPNVSPQKISDMLVWSSLDYFDSLLAIFYTIVFTKHTMR